MSDIKQWNDIKGRYGGGLVLGNGASIAVHGGFGYGSLFETAQEIGQINTSVARVFDRFDTDDFEMVLRRLWQATLVNEAMGVKDDVVQKAYEDVKNALINTVRHTHVDYDEAKESFHEICNFMLNFNTVVSLNYDLIVYWALLYGNSAYDKIHFKDCFLNGRFRDNWAELREPYGGVESPTLIFYPHGNLALARDIADVERKIHAHEQGRLLSAILERWEIGGGVPIFVCEGTTDHKKTAIGSSRYLERVNREVLTDLGRTVVVYGWGIGGQDKHLVDQINKNRPMRVAVSVYGHDQDLMARARRSFPRAEIEFFDACSPGAWIFP